MGVHHYVVIKNRNKLVSIMQIRELRPRNMLCRNCFHWCSSVDRLERYQLFCMRNEPAIVTMPKVIKSSVHFKIIVYTSEVLAHSRFNFFLDSVLEKVETVKNNLTSSAVFEKHNPSSFRFVVAEAGNPQPAFIHFIEEWTR